MDQEHIRKILTKYKVVAIVGVSQDPSKDGYRVAEYLKKHGFHIIPINPFADQILGEKCYRSLLDIPSELQKKLEIIDIFRPSEKVPSIVNQIIQLKKSYGVPHVVWMQLGITNEQAAEIARDVGLKVVMNKCMMQEHRRISVSNTRLNS